MLALGQSVSAGENYWQGKEEDEECDSNIQDEEGYKTQKFQNVSAK